MKSEVQSGAQVRLEQVRGDIEDWRTSRAKLGPMPEALWENATIAARELGLYPVARALRLNYAALKQRVAAGTAGERGAQARRVEPARKARVDFVEVSNRSLLSGFSSEGMVVEVVAADGARLTVRARGGSPDIAALVSAFRERQ